MTREEAILCLKGIKNYARDTFTEQSDWQESLDMAIDAFEAVSKIVEAWNEEEWPEYFEERVGKILKEAGYI